MASLGRAGEWRPPEQQRIGGAAGEALAWVAHAMAGTSPEDGIFSLQKAERLIGERPALNLLIARLMVARGERESALQRYRAVRGLLAYAPVVLLEQAESKSRTTNTSKAARPCASRTVPAATAWCCSRPTPRARSRNGASACRRRSITSKAARDVPGHRRADRGAPQRIRCFAA